MPQAKDQEQAKETLRKDVLFEGKTIGFVEVGLSLAGVEKNSAEVSRRIEEMVRTTQEELTAASWRLRGGGPLFCRVLVSFPFCHYPG